jgi:hypothetical protein
MVEVNNVDESLLTFGFVLSDTVSYNGQIYYVVTSFVWEDKALETMVFKFKRPLSEVIGKKEFTEAVDWQGIYLETHKGKEEAKKIHFQIVDNLRQYGTIRKGEE